MKKPLALLLGIGMLCGASAGAIAADKQDSKAKDPIQAPTQALTPQEQAKQQLINDLGIMQNQEMRVIVLQQLLNREAADLRQAQAVFCDQYKLDVDKWRKGLYRYDDKQAKFVEVSAAPQAK